MSTQGLDDIDLAFIAEALPAFLSEADEQVRALEALLLQLEDQPGDRELLNALFRCAHTVKGSAGLFGLDALVGFTHHMETLLSHLREGTLALTPGLSTLLLRCNDQVRVLVGEAGGQVPDAAAAAQRAQLAQALQDALPAAGAPRSGAPAPARAEPATGTVQRWRVQAQFGADTFRDGMDPLAIVQYLLGLGTPVAARLDTDAVPTLESLEPERCHIAFVLELDSAAGAAELEGAFVFVQDGCRYAVEPVQPAAAAPEPPARPAAAPVPQADPAAAGRVAAQRSAGGEDQRFIRVQAHRLDDVINLLGELVIAGAGAADLARQTQHRQLIEANAQINRLVEEIRNGTLQLRMVPIGETFTRFRRVVRDTAAELGKDVMLELVGGESELDKSVVERIADPLMHLVRNALDHGLEPAAERLAAGKPAQGRLVLSACHVAGSIVIRIEDDGRGIQRTKVLERAWDRGLVERGVVPSDEVITRLIFEPGFSTAEAVTNLSGRGVGMDVVRSNIEALRGSVTITSEEGRGSCIEIRLPLTLAIIDGFLVGVGPSRFIFPLDAVVEVIENRTREADLDRRGRGVVELRGQVLPVVSLRALYALPPAPVERSSVVVLQAGNRRYGVLVDALLGQHQTVIKPLGRMFRSLRGMSGSSILGNGDVALIFDVTALSQLAAEPLEPPRERSRNLSMEGLVR
jgi:two-component system, chemotaxis family, sensor kinase CheA